MAPARTHRHGLVSDCPACPVAGFSQITGRPVGVRNEASLACARGTTVQAEFYTGEGDGIGVATDSGGNVYRILF